MFNVRSDLIDEHLLFLIGLSFLLAVRDSLKFWFSYLSMSIRRIVFSLQLVKRSAELELLLFCTVTHQRQTNHSNNLCFVSSSVSYSSRQCFPRKSFCSPTVKEALLSPLHTATLAMSDLRKTHLQLGNVRATKIKSSLWETLNWNKDYAGMVN